MNCDNAATILVRLMEASGTSQRKLAEKLGWSPQLLNSRLKKDNFPANDWLDAIRETGHKVMLVPCNEAASGFSRRTEGICPDFRKVVDGITYDRATSTALGHQWFSGGVSELYQTDEGRYFILTQICWPEMKATVIPIDRVTANSFLNEPKTIKR